MPYHTWVDLLEKSGLGLTADEEVYAARSNPALKLVDFFKAVDKKKSTSADVSGMPKLDITVARTVSQYLDTLAPLSTETLRGWIHTWRESGFLP